MTGLICAGLVSLSLFLSLSFTLHFSLPLLRSPLTSTDRFHNHFSEVTASSAVVTQLLACSVSFTCAHIVHYMHTHTTTAILHCPSKNAHLKEAVSQHPQHEGSSFKGLTCLLLALHALKCSYTAVHVRAATAEGKCNTGYRTNFQSKLLDLKFYFRRKV